MPPRRARQTSIAANPVLLGAATVLIVLVAVFLSYNANSGLPFVPTYQVTAQVPDAAELVVGNDVRLGGSRVGVVKRITAAEGRTQPSAKIEMALETSVKPLPADTRVVIRQRSNLGLKYVELVPGRKGGANVPDGGTIALKNATGVVDLDDALSAFDKPTRDAVDTVARDLGGGVAGRGPDLGQSLESAPGVLSSLGVVADTLSAPSTRLVPFIDGTDAALRAIDPVRGTLGELFQNGSTTFAAIAAQDAAIGRALEAGPGAELQASRALTALSPVLREARTFLQTARPGLRRLPASANRLSTALADSGPVLRSARPLAVQLGGTLTDLRTLARRKSVTPALRRTTQALPPLADALKTITPFQTRCNYLGLWGRNVPSVVSEGDQLGSWFRFIPIVKLDEELRSDKPSPTLHALTAPDTGYGGTCEAGNQVFVPGQQVGRSPGTPAGSTQDTSRPPLVGATR